MGLDKQFAWMLGVCLMVSSVPQGTLRAQDSVQLANDLVTAEKLCTEGSIERCYIAYEEIYRVHHLPHMLRRMGQLKKQMGQCKVALQHFREYEQRAAPFSDRERKDLNAEVQGAERCFQPVITSRDPGTDALKVAANAGGRGVVPVYKRWWFWTAIAAVTAGAGAGIAVAVVGHNRVPNGVYNYAPTFN